jgi:aarF domain-containing kinase
MFKELSHASFAGLGAGLAWGTLQESAKRVWGGQGSTVPGQAVLSPFLTEANAERLAVALCRMRGAALKVGQMLSIQDESIVPRPVLNHMEAVVFVCLSCYRYVDRTSIKSIECNSCS